MIEINDDVLKSILAIQRSNPPAWVRFMDWMSQLSINQSSKSINEKDDVELRWSQGRQQIISELINVFNNVDKLIAIKEKRPYELRSSLVFD